MPARFLLVGALSPTFQVMQGCAPFAGGLAAEVGAEQCGHRAAELVTMDTSQRLPWRVRRGPLTAAAARPRIADPLRRASLLVGRDVRTLCDAGAKAGPSAGSRSPGRPVSTTSEPVVAAEPELGSVNPHAAKCSPRWTP